jgi:hypothetical protein
MALRHQHGPTIKSRGRHGSILPHTNHSCWDLAYQQLDSFRQVGAMFGVPRQDLMSLTVDDVGSSDRKSKGGRMMSSIENQIEAGRRRMQNDEVEVDRAVFNAAAECSLPALVEALDMGAQFREVNAGGSKSCDCCRLRKLALLDVTPEN